MVSSLFYMALTGSSCCFLILAITRFHCNIILLHVGICWLALLVLVFLFQCFPVTLLLYRTGQLAKFLDNVCVRAWPVYVCVRACVCVCMAVVPALLGYRYRLD